MTKRSELNVARRYYITQLSAFDAAICEAVAVSQACSGRKSSANVGYASYVFARMCGAGISLIRGAPLTRWVRADFDDWQLSALAGHARSLLDGFLLFNYLIEPIGSEDELRARIDVMHINDCTRRIKLHEDVGATQDLSRFEAQRDDLRKRLIGNDYFNSLPPGVRKRCLNGQFLMISARGELLERLGINKGGYDAIYDLWSHHIHILPISFYRLEPSGRGTGVENETDRTYMAEALQVGSAILVSATDLMVNQFPDTASTRRGIESAFSPGPTENVRNWRSEMKRRLLQTSPAENLLTKAIRRSLEK